MSIQTTSRVKCTKTTSCYVKNKTKKFLLNTTSYWVTVVCKWCIINAYHRTISSLSGEFNVLLINRVDVELDLIRWKSLVKWGGIAVLRIFGEYVGWLSSAVSEKSVSKCVADEFSVCFLRIRDTPQTTKWKFYRILI
jgi:hypothetical protein